MASSDSQPPTSQMAAAFACDQCPVEYDNPSHLDRHRQIHVEQAKVERSRIERANADRANAGRNRNICPHCQGRFTTGDVLQRHVDAYHGASTNSAAKLRAACQRCHRYKLRCDGTSPCRMCAVDAASGKCVPLSPQIIASPDSDADADADPAQSPGSAPGPHASPQQRPQMQGAQSVESTPPPGHHRQPLVSGYRSPDEDMTSPTGSVDSTMYAAPQPPAPGEFDIRTVSLCWLDFEVSNVRRQGLDGQSAGGADNNAATSRLPAPAQLFSLQGTFDVDAPLLLPRPSLPRTLSGPIGSSFASSSLVMAIDSLGLLFKEPGIPRVAEMPASKIRLLPGIELLRQLVDNYFLKWQKVQPVFHVASWKISECPMVLLGAMACIGSLLAEENETLHQAHHISSRCVSELNIMVTTPPERCLDLTNLAALCLHQTYLLGSGDEHIHRHVDRIRGYMVSGLRAFQLLGNNVGLQNSTQMFEESSQSLQAEWMGWVAREQGLRLAWMVFEHDCNVSLLTNRPCVIELGHLPKRFPCGETLYDAPDARAWVELRSRSPYGAHGPLVSSVMAVAGTRNTLSEHISSWSKRLCTQIFERILRGVLRAAERNSTIRGAQGLGLALASASVENKASLLWSISFLGKSIHDGATIAPLSTMDLVNFSSTKLMRHYNHFDLYPRIMDFIIYIARTAASPSSPSSRTSLRWAQSKLLAEFAADPYQSRQYIWHAGQMVRVSNVYAVYAPGDNLRIFTAYLVILAFAKYGPRSVKDMTATDPFHADAWPYCDTAVENWLQTGGPAQIGSCARIQAKCSTEQIMQEAFKLLCRIENWGLSERFFNILIHFNDLDVLGE
ncbi:hypothetical protein V8C37DRAFT_140051 [Trichoderma ceciliae]